MVEVKFYVWAFYRNIVPICRCPRSQKWSTTKVVKIVELALPMSLMHSVISFIEYLLMWEFWLSSLKSWMIRSPQPCFFGMQKMGELLSEFDLLTTPNFNHSSSVCSMNWWCASGILIVSRRLDPVSWDKFCAWSPWPDPSNIYRC